MTRQQLDDQIGSVLAVYYVTLGAAMLLGTKADLMMWKLNQKFSQEAKQRMNAIKQGMAKVKYGLDFFYDNMLDSLVTDEGKTDLRSTSNAFMKDANQIAQAICEMYNAKSKHGKIRQEIIDYFSLERKEHEDQRTNNRGDTTA